MMDKFWHIFWDVIVENIVVIVLTLLLVSWLVFGIVDAAHHGTVDPADYCSGDMTAQC
jgi:hypothetical protein